MNLSVTDASVLDSDDRQITLKVILSDGRELIISALDSPVMANATAVLSFTGGNPFNAAHVAEQRKVFTVH